MWIRDRAIVIMRLSLLLPQVLSVLLLAAVGFLPTARAQLDGIAIPGNDYGNNTIRQNNFTDVVQW